RLAGGALELVQFEIQLRSELGQLGVGRPPTGGGVPLGGTAHTLQASAPPGESAAVAHTRLGQPSAVPAPATGARPRSVTGRVSNRSAPGWQVTVIGSGRHRSPSA